MNNQLKVEIINQAVEGEILPKHNFEDLMIVTDAVSEYEYQIIEKVLMWFKFLQTAEIEGWRNKAVTQKIAKILADNSKDNPLLFYSLFCPSYKKGENISGFRTDDVGLTTKSGVANLLFVYKKTKQLGFYCTSPLAIFFDLALEQPEKIMNTADLADLEINILNLQNLLPKQICFKRLSLLDKKLFRTIGFSGLALNPLPIPQKTFEKIVNRGFEFYKHFGWSKQKVIDRSKIIASSEAMVGDYLKQNFKNAICLYTATMLERAEVYSGMEYQTDPLPIVFPKRLESEINNDSLEDLNQTNGVVVTS
ncbi:MAG: hypothetical protein AAB546_01045 [Patescibacteria group bacterium]